MNTAELTKNIEQETGAMIELHKVHLTDDVYDVEYFSGNRLHQCKVFNSTGEVILQEASNPFTWILDEGPCEVTVYNMNNDTGVNLNKTYSFIGSNTKDIINTAVRNNRISKSGFAHDLDESIAPYVESIKCLGLSKGEQKKDSLGQFKPMMRFQIKGTLPKHMPLEEFLDRIEQSMLEQSRYGWGQDFDHKAVKHELKRNRDCTVSSIETYLNPWTPQSAVYFADTHE